jgi:hypothetical protein
MSQNERNEAPAAALEYERLRRKDISLLDIGMRRAKGDFKVAKVEASRRKGVEAEGGLHLSHQIFCFASALSNQGPVQYVHFAGLD